MESIDVGVSVEAEVGAALLVGAEFDDDGSLDELAGTVIDEGAEAELLLEDEEVEDVFSAGVVVPPPEELPPGVCGTGGMEIWMTT